MRKPSELMGAMTVFSKLIVLVVGGHLLECAPYDSGATVMLVYVGVFPVLTRLCHSYLITLFSFTDRPTQAGVVFVFTIDPFTLHLKEFNYALMKLHHFPEYIAMPFLA